MEDEIQKLREDIYQMAKECPYLQVGPFSPKLKRHVDTFELSQMSACITHMLLLTQFLEKHNKLRYFQEKNKKEEAT